MRVHQLARKHNVLSKYLAPELHKRGLVRHPSASSWVCRTNNWRVWLSVRAAKKAMRNEWKAHLIMGHEYHRYFAKEAAHETH